MNAQATAHPLLIEPIHKPKVWGGRSLARLFGREIPEGKQAIGESWELADLPADIADGRSRIASGPVAGMTVRDLIGEHRQAIMGDAPLTDEGGFPLLVKFLDARENLSVQVHPSPTYAYEHPEAHLKSEAWVVIDAQPGAVIYRGLKPGVTREQFAEHIASGAVVDDLIAVPVKPGDCHYLPSGTCHALGGGIVVAEVQTPSDTTFRVYDWDRPATDGQQRDLHIEQALQCIDFGDGEPSGDQTHSAAPPLESKGLCSTLLCSCRHFEIERIDARQPAQLPIVTSNRPVVWMQLSGTASFVSPGHSIQRANPGDTFLLPAALERVAGGASVQLDTLASALHITVPPPIHGAIA